MPREGKLVLALGVAVLAFIVANATANKLSKPMEDSRLWRQLFG